MNTAFVIIVLVGIPLLFLIGAFNPAISSRIWKTSTTLQRFLMWIAIFVPVLIALLELSGLELRIAGLPLSGWAVLLFIAFIAARFFRLTATRSLE
jgi:hypothetical protein